MSKREIDKKCKLYQQGKLTNLERKQLAQAIELNKRTRKIALIGAMIQQDFRLAYFLS